jgi:hypothetical protein
LPVYVVYAGNIKNFSKDDIFVDYPTRSILESLEGIDPNNASLLGRGSPRQQNAQWRLKDTSPRVTKDKYVYGITISFTAQ